MMTHRDALDVLAAHRREQVVVTTMSSVALWPQLSDSPLDFHYLPSSMGQGVPVGLGLCLSQPGRGVVVLTDVYGATPGNIAARLLVPGSVEGIAGVNLPMLVRALTYRNEPLDVVIAKALSGGIDGVIRMPAAIQNAATGS